MSIQAKNTIAHLASKLATARRHASILPVASLIARVGDLESAIVDVIHAEFA